MYSAIIVMSSVRISYCNLRVYVRVQPLLNTELTTRQPHTIVRMLQRQHTCRPQGDPVGSKPCRQPSIHKCRYEDYNTRSARICTLTRAIVVNTMPGDSNKRLLNAST
jgi:hypothetical protein